MGAGFPPVACDFHIWRDERAPNLLGETRLGEVFERHLRTAPSNLRGPPMGPPAPSQRLPPSALVLDYPPSRGG
eukprot:7620533-Pyramimonas_sp.AAC.1